MKIQGNLRISIDVDGHLGLLEFRTIEEISHNIILDMDFGVELGLLVRLLEMQWKCEDQGEWYSFATNSNDYIPAIMVECAGLAKMTPTEAEVLRRSWID